MSTNAIRGWSPDGKSIAFVSDASGEDEIYVMAADGKDSPNQLTTGADTYKYEIAWSPDSKKIVWGDKKLRVQYVEVATKAVKLVHQAKVWEVRDAVFSPDSKWIAFSQQEEEGLSKVYLHSVEQGKSYEVTDGWFGSAGPVFSGDGKYLLFVSSRGFNPIYSDTEWNHAYKDMQRIYLVTLAKDTPSPFQPRNDELEGPKEDGKKDGPIKVDVDGIKDRILQLPANRPVTPTSSPWATRSITFAVAPRTPSRCSMSSTWEAARKPDWDPSPASKSRPTAKR